MDADAAGQRGGTGQRGTAVDGLDQVSGTGGVD